MALRAVATAIRGDESTQAGRRLAANPPDFRELVIEPKAEPRPGIDADNFPAHTPAMPHGTKLSEFIAWRQKTSPPTKKGLAQKF
jgi:hypothetical protein